GLTTPASLSFQAILRRSPDFCREAIDERALAVARRTVDPNQVRASRLRKYGGDEAGGRGVLVLDERNRAGHGSRISGEHPRREAVGSVHASRCRAMTSRWISLVPSPMVVSFTSRKNFSAG